MTNCIVLFRCFLVNCIVTMIAIFIFHFFSLVTCSRSVIICPQYSWTEYKTVIEGPWSFANESDRVESEVNLTIRKRTQARSQKFAMGGLFWGSRRRPIGVWGLRPQPPEDGGLGAKPPAAGSTGVWGRIPQRSKLLHFFAKITSF